MVKYRCKRCGVEFENKARAMWHSCFQNDIEEIGEAESFFARLWKSLKDSILKNA